MALSACTYASAGVIATIDNENGGKINFMDVAGPCEVGKLALASGRNGTTFRGCWTFDADQAFVTFESGETRVYPGAHMQFPHHPPKNRAGEKK